MVRPSRGVAGDFSYATDSASLLRMLKKDTELRSAEIEQFRSDLQIAKSARLLGVEMSFRALSEIGYFLD